MWIRAALVPFAGRRLVAGQGHRRLLTTSLRAHEGAAQTDETQDEYPAWTPDSRRVGLVAKKLGMTATWDDNNRRVTLTALQIVDNHVLQVKTKDKDGFWALQVGAVDEPIQRRVTKPIREHCAKAGVAPKRKIHQFKVTEDAVVPPGTALHAGHFIPGQFVDVRGTTIGKGFQGVMKRHGMKGQPASHGQTKTHRKMGATGGGQDPGRVWPGKKMAGRMGGKTAMQLNLKVHRVDERWNIVFVEGSIPGHKNSYVKVMDARRKKFEEAPPFPTKFTVDEAANSVASGK